uniref:Zinc finger, CCHC-type n=1 Tax=Tanacetum cinerariifolium TaxID=118510 RepID=A0A6L2ME42_TANCI|nr:hypothetical protein [Tanacetum cinerariifolium]
MIELDSHLRIEESLRVQDSDKPKGNNVAGPSVVNVMEHDNSSRYNDNKGKRKYHDTKEIAKMDDDVAWWVDSRATVYVCKDSVLNNCGYKQVIDVFTGFGYLSSHMFKLNIVSDNIGSAFKSTSKLNDSILWHARLGHVHFKRMQDMSKDGVWGCRAAVRIPDPKLKTLGERGIECIFVGYAKHSKAFMFYVIEPIDSVAINSIIESNDAIFNVHRVTDKRFKQKSRIDYFDTYAPVARISTIGLLIAMASIHNLIIQQMDVKTAFLNGELEQEVYMNQPLGFIMRGYENKVCKLIKSMFSIKDMGKADVILGIKIKHKSSGLAISQSHYIEKVMKKLNYSDCTLVSTPLDTCEKLMPNKGPSVSQHSRLIGCLMYAMTCTKPDIAFVVGKLSSYPSVLEGYIDARWISNSKDNSSTSGWVFLLGGGANSWASKKQTCIAGLTMKSEFVALAVAGVRHNMIRELITNGVVSIEFVRSQQNFVDHLTKGLARDLVIKSAHVLQIILRMFLEPADKEDEVANFSMVNFFEKVLKWVEGFKS